MNKKITTIIIEVIFVGLIISCQKSNVDKTASARTNTAINSLTLSEAKMNIQPRISTASYEDLDWANALIWKSNDEETMLIVKSRLNPQKYLTYVTSTKLKMFDWESEIHFIMNNPQ